MVTFEILILSLLCLECCSSTNTSLTLSTPVNNICIFECESLVRDEFTIRRCRPDLHRLDSACDCTFTLLGLKLCAIPAGTIEFNVSVQKFDWASNNSANSAAQIILNTQISLQALPVGVLNNLMYPSQSQFAPDANMTKLDIIVYLPNESASIVYDATLNGFQQNIKPFAMATERCYQSIKTGGACVVLGVTSATYQIGAFDFVCAVMCSVCDLISSVGTLSFIASAGEYILGSFVVIHTLMSLAATWAKFYYPPYLCETIMCMKTVHNAVIIFAMFVPDMFRVTLDILIANSQESKNRFCGLNKFFSLFSVGSSAFTFMWLVKDLTVLNQRSPGVWVQVIGVIAGIFSAFGMVVHALAKLFVLGLKFWFRGEE